MSTTPERLSPSDPRCLSPAIAKIYTGLVAADDPKAIAAADNLARYCESAPMGEHLDSLEHDAGLGKILMVRQSDPGVYVYTWMAYDGHVFVGKSGGRE